MGLQRLHARSMEAIAQIISGSQLVPSPPDIIKSHLSDWSNEGKKLDDLCRDVQDQMNDGHGYLGILFCLPKDVGKEYLRVLPKNGKEREYEIQQLQERGILAVERLEELNSLADAIYRYLWTCLDQSHIQTSNTPTDHIFMALEHTGSQISQSESTPHIPYPYSLESSSSRQDTLCEVSLQGTLDPNSTLSSETRDVENCYIPDQDLQISAQAGASVIHSPSTRNPQMHQVSQTDGATASHLAEGERNLVPFDPSEYIHAMSLPVGSAASYLAEGERNLVPFDPSEYIHAMSLPVGSAASYLAEGERNLVPFDPSEYIHPVSLLDRPVASYLEGGEETSNPFDHFQHATPSYESITRPLEATQRVGRGSQPAEASELSSVGYSSPLQAEFSPCLQSADPASPRAQGQESVQSQAQCIMDSQREHSHFVPFQSAETAC
ncbi:hypothetical protein CBS147309_9605 [Penicillium roqueforti]|nr:hypothetical protein CBS147309_9605 [Penicillium roqueforti]